MNIIRLLAISCALFFNIVLLTLPALAQGVTSRYDADTGQFTLDATDITSSSSGSLTYSWVITSGPPGSTAFIDTPNEPVSGFSADILGQYSIELQISEAGVVRTPLQVTLSTDGSSPVAGFDIVGLPVIGEAVRLDARDSYHLDGLALSYEWELTALPDGSVAVLDPVIDGSSGFARTFVPDLEGEYQVQLSVTDWSGRVDTLLRTITTGAAMPVADAGPDRSVQAGATVFLDPFASINPGIGNPDAGDSVESAALEAGWSLVYRPDGSVAVNKHLKLILRWRLKLSHLFG